MTVPTRIPPTAVPMNTTITSGFQNHPLKTPTRLPQQAAGHVATATNTSTAAPLSSTVSLTRAQLLAALRNMRVALGYRLRGRKAAVPRSIPTLEARLAVLERRLRQRTAAHNKRTTIS